MGRRARSGTRGSAAGVRAGRARGAGALLRGAMPCLCLVATGALLWDGGGGDAESASARSDATGAEVARLTQAEAAYAAATRASADPTRFGEGRVRRAPSRAVSGADAVAGEGMGAAALRSAPSWSEHGRVRAWLAPGTPLRVLGEARHSWLVEVADGPRCGLVGWLRADEWESAVMY